MIGVSDGNGSSVYLFRSNKSLRLKHNFLKLRTLYANTPLVMPTREAIPPVLSILIEPPFVARPVSLQTYLFAISHISPLWRNRECRPFTASLMALLTKRIRLYTQYLKNMHRKVCKTCWLQFFDRFCIRSKFRSQTP